MKARIWHNLFIALTVAFLCLGTFGNNAQILSMFTQTRTKVLGTITDVHDAVLPGASIALESESSRFTTKSDQFGGYEFSDIPAGVYCITAEVAGFYRFQRAKFLAKPNQITTINLVLLQQYSWITLAVDASGAKYRTDEFPPPKYESFNVPFSNPLLQLTFRFKTRQRLNSSATYKQAVLFYNTLTIYADRFTMNTKTLRVIGNGDVMVDDGNGRRRVRAATLQFAGGQPQLTLITF